MWVEGIPASPGYAEGPLFDLDRPPIGYAAKASAAEEKKAASRDFRAWQH